MYIMCNFSIFKTAVNKIELLEATNEDSPIAKFINKNGEGIHHIAFDVDNIYEEITMECYLCIL